MEYMASVLYNDVSDILRSLNLMRPVSLQCRRRFNKITRYVEKVRLALEDISNIPDSTWCKRSLRKSVYDLYSLVLFDQDYPEFREQLLDEIRILFNNYETFFNNN